MSGLAARQSPLGTIAQTLPRLGRVLRNLRPTWHVRTLDDLTPTFLARHGILGILWDVDGTLTHFHAPRVAPEAAAFGDLVRQPTLRHAILSNAGEDRFQELGRIFPDIPILKGYLVNGTVQLRRAHRGSDDWGADRVARCVAEGGVPLRKPDGSLVLAAARALGVPPDGVVMVGDQYLTDIAGANLAGVRSVKLPAIGPETLPIGIRWGQRLERLLYRILHGAPRWEPPVPPHPESP